MCVGTSAHSFSEAGFEVHRARSAATLLARPLVLFRSCQQQRLTILFLIVFRRSGFVPASIRLYEPVRLSQQRLNTLFRPPHRKRNVTQALGSPPHDPFDFLHGFFRVFRLRSGRTWGGSDRGSGVLWLRSRGQIECGFNRVGHVRKGPRLVTKPDDYLRCGKIRAHAIPRRTRGSKSDSLPSANYRKQMAPSNSSLCDT